MRFASWTTPNWTAQWCAFMRPTKAIVPLPAVTAERIGPQRRRERILLVAAPVLRAAPRTAHDRALARHVTDVITVHAHELPRNAAPCRRHERAMIARSREKRISKKSNPGNGGIQVKQRMIWIGTRSDGLKGLVLTSLVLTASNEMIVACV